MRVWSNWRAILTAKPSTAVISLFSTGARMRRKITRFPNMRWRAKRFRHGWCERAILTVAKKQKPKRISCLFGFFIFNSNGLTPEGVTTNVSSRPHFPRRQILLLLRGQFVNRDAYGFQLQRDNPVFNIGWNIALVS